MGKSAQLDREIYEAIRSHAGTHPDHLCARCGAKFSAHAALANPIAPNGCPSGEFPRWPSSIKDDARAGRLFDKRVAAFWKASKSTFSPKR